MSKNENTTSVESMTERYSFGHKAISVALSVVLLGFGWPAVSPSAANAEGDQATTATATQAAGDTAASASASASGAAATSATAASDVAAGSASSAADTGSAAATAASGTQGTGAVAADVAASDADVQLTLGNASITYKGQVIAQPAQKVTVSATDDFEFSVTPDNGYALTQVKLKVAGANESILTPNNQGVYIVTAANVAAGAAVTLVTEEQQAATEPAQDATPIEQTATDAAAAVAADAQSATDTQADAGSISGPNVVKLGDTIKLTYNGDMTIDNWYGGDGFFSEWNVSSDKKTLTLTATDTWRFNGSEATATIYLGYIDKSGVWHNGENGIPFKVTVKKRTFTIVQPDPVAEGESHYWIPQIKDDENGKIITLSGDLANAFSIDYYRDNQWIGNQYNHSDEEFKKSGTYTVVVKPNSGWIYDFGDTGQIEITMPAEKLSVSGPDTVKTGKTIDLTTTGATTTVKWTSSDPSIATVDENGKVTGVKPGTVTIWATSGTQSASKDVTVTRDETGGYYVYMYTKVYGSTQGLTLVPNNKGWYTIGRLWVPGIRYSGDVGGSHRTSGPDWDATMEALKDPANIDLYGVNSVNLSDIQWNVSGMKDQTNATGLTTTSTGASDYVGAGWTWHLDGYVYVLGMGSVKYNHIDKATGQQISNTTSVTAKEDTVLDSASYKQNITGYSYDSASVDSVAVQKGTTLEVNLYYTKGSYPYTVRYLEQGTDKELKQTQQKGGEFGSTVTETAPSIVGYNPVETSKSLSISADGENVITFYYTKKPVEYTINYLWNGTDEKVAESETINGKLFGDEVTASAKNIDGCTLVSSDNSQTITLGENDNSINFYYYKKVAAKANSRSVTYNKEPQSVSGYAVVDSSDITKEVPNVKFEGIEAGAEGTNAGDYPSTFAKKPVSPVDTSGKYIIADYINGNLHIAPVSETKYVTIKGNSAEKVYNGEEQSVFGWSAELDDNTITVTGPAQESVVAKGIDASSTAYTTNMTATEFTAKSVNYTDIRFVFKQGSLTIAKRPLAITGEGWTESQPYTGAAYTTDKYTVEPANAEDTRGLVSGHLLDGLTYSLTGVNHGSYEGAFSGELVISKGTKDVTSNYEIAEIAGKLQIDAVRIENAVKLTTHNVSSVYVAKGIEAEAAEATDESNPDYGFKIEYQKQDGTWTTNPKDITVTNVWDSLTGDNAIKVRVTDPNGNYKGELTGSESVVVTKRPAKITGNGWSVTQYYTGNEYATTDFKVEKNNATSGTGIMVISGQQVVASYELKGADVGDYTGKFSDDKKVIDGNGNDVTGNYDLKWVPGKLSIAKDEIAKHVKLETSDVEKVYDGTAHTAGTATAGAVSATSDGNVGNLTIEYQIPGTDTWTINPTDISATNVTDTIINVRVSSDKYNDYVTGTQKLTITQRPIEFVGQSDTLVYTGSEQELTGITVASAEDGQAAGLAEGQTYEGLTYSAKGVAAGSYAGEFSGSVIIKNGANDDVTANYSISQAPGELKISPIDGVTVTITGATASKEYNGQVQSVSGYAFASSSSLYKETDFGLAERKEAKAEATHVSEGTVKMSLSSDSFKNNNSNFTNVKFVVAQDGGITITPATLMVTTPSDKQVYNGKPLTKEGSIAGFVNNESAPFKTTGTQTDVGMSSNTYVIDWMSNDATAQKDDYKVVEDLGTLEVTAKAVTALEVIAPEDIVYNGLEQKQKPEVKDGETTLAEGVDYTLSYSEDATNVGVVTITVTGKGNYAGTVDCKYQITPAALTVVTPDAEKVYDGIPLTAAGSMSGLVNNETATLNTTGSQLEVGGNPNTYEIKWDGTAKKTNYVVSDTVGTLTVMPQSIEPGPGEDYKGVEVDKPQNVPYDGEAHKWVPAVTGKAAGSNATALVEGTDYEVSYARDGKATDDFTNAGTITVTIAGKGNYAGSVARTYQITPLEVTITTGSNTKVYDGTELTSDKGSIEGLVASEKDGVEVVPNGKQVEVGSSKNTYTINWGSVNSNNYKVVKEELGTLTVTPQSLVPGTEEKPNDSYKGVEVDAPSDSVYDGEAHKWVPAVTGKAAGSNATALVEGTDYEVSYARDGKATDDFTNAGTITVTVTGKGNYAGSVTRTYQITPAPLTITTPGDEKTYDGTPLTKSAAAADCVSGLVKDETVGFKTTGSRTEVGSDYNTYEITWNGTAKQGNYEIKSVSLGKLVVKESADQIVVTTTGGEFTYDGQAHGATVTVGALPAGYTLETAASTATATDVTQSDVAATADQLVIRNAAGEDVTSKLNIKKVDGTIKVTPATLTVVTPDASKVYDGSALTAAGMVTGFVNGETATFETTGSQTSEGSSSNTYKITWNGTAKQGNYAVAETLGTLTVSAQSIDPGTSDKPNPSFKGVQVGQLTNTVYNGQEQKFEPQVTDANGAVLVKDRDYTLAWSADATNAGTVTVTVTGAGNYAGSVTRTYAIAKRPVTLKSESATKSYDGVALERPDVAVTSYYDFVDGEVEGVKATGSVLNAGSEQNAIEITGVKGKYNPKNYDVTFDEGTLTVTKADAASGITLQTKSASKLYDGNALALPEAAASVKQGQGANVVTIEYQKADGSWTKNASDISATDVADSREVAVRASSPTNYGGYAYGTATLSVGVRSVTLKSNSASKVFDGEALTAPEVIVGGDGFVSGEVTDIAATGAITKVGSTSNAISYKTGESFKPGNYNIQEQPGTLTVTEQSIDPGTSDKPNPSFAGVEVSAPSNSVYDGQAHQWTPTVTDKNGIELAAGTDYEVAYSTNDFTNVTGAIAVTITGKGNYAGAVTRTYEITPAPVKVETFSNSKTYDGTELTAGGQVTGVVAGETYDFAATGSQTAVGSSDNTYRLNWNGTAKETNYQVVETKIGTLTVNEAADEVTVTTTGGTFAYDGQDHGATVAVTGLPAGYYVENAYSNASARNVADGTVAATADVLVIKNAQGQDVTDKLNIKKVDGGITITAAPLTIITGSASKQYDGIAATSDTATAEGAKGSDRVTVWATGEQTEVGSSSNTYGIYWGAVDQRNYTVTENLGTLQVEPNAAAVTIEGASASKTYDGTALATNKVASFTGLPAGFTVELAATGNRTDVGNSENTVSSYTIKSMYGDDATAFFTNVTVVPGTLTVEPAELTVTTQGAEKVFDGTPLTNDNGEVAGLVNGETATVVPNGSQTEVGTSSNGYSMQWGTAKSGNYKIVSETLGTLKVTAQSITPGPNPDEPNSTYKGIQVSNPADMVYDGQAHQWAPEVTDGNKVLAEGTDYTVAYSTNDFTNVTGAITTTITGKGNYAGTVERSYQIVPRNVELASDTDSKPYDGTALTRPGVTVTSAYDFVAGEVSDLAATGSALNAGDAVTNTITYTKGAAYRDANYNVAKREGTLSVYAKQITASDMTVGTVNDVTYNGKEQKQKPEVKDGNKTLVEGVDYDLVYSDDVTNAGSVTVTVVGKGNYAGSVDRSYTIKKAPLTVVTSSASKAYDGTELTAAGTINGFVNGETAAFAVTGTQTTVGSSKNWYAIDWNGTAKAANYGISETVGTLTVTESENEVVATTTGGTFTYDGQAHGATVEVTGLPAGYTAQASSDATATDANGEGVTATANNLVIRNTNGEDVTASLNVKRIDGTVKVVPAELTVVTPDASKTYDGSALTAAGSIAGFVNGETATLNTTGSQTEVGSSQNTYEIAWDGTAKQGNYTVNATVGTLTVNAQSITPGPNPDEPDPTYRGIQVSSPVDVEYDGQAHQWAPEVTDAGKALTAGTDYDVAYSTNDFTNVTGTITVTITGKGNYTGSVTRTYQITPAPLSVETYSDFKVYDGNALTAGGKLDGLKNGETATFAATGSQTEVGSSQNGYTLAFDQTAKGSNYRIASENLGTLSVAESGEQIVVTTTGGTFTYDGQAHGATVAVSQLPEGYTLETAASSATATNVADGVVAATADQLVIVNAQGQDVTNKLNIVKVDGQLEVTPAELVIATASSTKQFDNTPLTNNSMSITGLVPGDSVTAKTTGSQTAVGTSKNTYEITWTNADASNYSVIEQLGDLTVTAPTVVPATPVQPGGTTPTPTTPGTTPSGAATPTGVPANPGNPVDAIAQVLENAVEAVTGTSDQPAEEQIFDDENPLGTTAHANCWVHWFMIIGMILTVLYGAGVTGRRTRFAHSLNANMKDVLNASEEKN